MAERIKVACIQNHAGVRTASNLTVCSDLVTRAAGDDAALICLPEYFTGLDVRDGVLMAESFAESEHPALPLFADLARRHAAWLLLGSLAIADPRGRVVNRAYLLDASGTIAARYDKIHLFDVDLAGGESYRESATIAAGERAVIADLLGFRLGLSICYDLRFPQLYRSLAQAGAEVIAVPSAFTKTTGEAHWHTLLRARAIETGCYVAAPCQCGAHAGGGASYGHSLIVDPWGRVLADGGSEPGVVIAEIDLAEVRKARAMVPALEHDRDFAAPKRAAPELPAAARA